MGKKVKFDFKRFFWLSLCFTVIFCILLAWAFLKIKPLVYTYAKSYAETLFLNAANKAVAEILKETETSYGKIANLSKNSEGQITSLEIDIEKINLLKSLISNQMSEDLANNEYYDLKIPIGSLIGSEYTTGIGPKITFSMQTTCTAFVDFKSNFYSAGINQVLHQILITIDVKGNILMLGCTDGFSAKTTAIAAQTVIVGLTPDAYTNVIEGATGGSIVGDIFDYGYVEYDSNGE